MNYIAFATDYDGTLATEGRVLPTTLEALASVRRSGRRTLLVTGRELEDLARVFDRLDLFDLVVAENGALVMDPASGAITATGAVPPPAFVEALRARGVGPISVGHVIVATWEPHQAAVLETIREFGLEHQIIFNKGAVMILPPGVNKATGLAKALEMLGLAASNVVAAGDAENDHAFLMAAGCGVAVANALPMLKQTADLVTDGARGAGIEELVDRLIATDLREIDAVSPRHRIALGEGLDGSVPALPTRGINVLLAGDSGAGKSTLTIGLLERLASHGLQFCVIDPEGDYDQFEGAVVLGGADLPVDPAQAIELLTKDARQSLILNLLGIPLADRPAFLADLVPQLQRLRLQTGRPHWIVIDEAHHMLPGEAGSAAALIPDDFKGLFLVTVHPDEVAPAVVASIDRLLTTGKLRGEILEAFCRVAGMAAPSLEGIPPHEPGLALAWDVRTQGAVLPFRVIPPQGEHKRHVRKYAEGRLDVGRSFFFRGPEGALNLRAHNVAIFLQIAEGVDEATWDFHFRRGDYPAWFRKEIKDEGLAAEIEAMMAENLAPAESRSRVLAAVNARYTAPARTE